MNRIWIVAALTLALAVGMIGCSSPQDKAAKLMNEGKYEEVIAQYGNDASLAATVTAAKDKLAEKLFAEGKFAEIVEKYPETQAAKNAREKLAAELLQQKKFQEVIDKYGDTQAAMIAKLELERAKNPDGSTGTGNVQTPASNENAAKADAELDRIMKIKIPDLRKKALQEFVANPTFKGTKAAQKAQAELGK